MPLPEIRGRIRALVEFAAANESTISFQELRALLPAGQFPTEAAFERFLATDELLSIHFTAIGPEVTMRGREDLASQRLAQQDLTRKRLAEANRFVGVLTQTRPWIELAGVSGSTAYAGAKPQDDIDFFVVTGKRRLWITLLLLMATARLTRLRSRDAPVYCFNRVMELPKCEQDFRENKEPLFAREALNLFVLHGKNLYGHLLATAPWMEAHFPTLYATRLNGSELERFRRRDDVHSPGRILNMAAFVGLGPYLWLAGLVRNVRLRRAGRNKECFRTVIRPEWYATESETYDELREAYRKAFA